MAVNLLNTNAVDPTHAILGVDSEGNTFHYPISEGPHWIIAGMTGGGKSVYMNAILVSMFAHAHPDELDVVWIDPKIIEATAYVDLPFCPINPVTNMDDAYGLLTYATVIMDERFEEFARVSEVTHAMLNKKVIIKNLKQYHNWYDDNKDFAIEHGFERFTYFVMVIDEYNDMVMQNKDVEALIVRLAQKGRAGGLHCLIATQRPSADVISSIIKANVPCRVAMKVTDENNSNIILGEPFAKDLKGNGDSIVMLKDGSFNRVQGPYIKEEEIETIFSEIREKYPPKKKIDYKKRVVDLGLAEWAVEGGYPEGTPEQDIHIVKPARRMGGFGR